MYNLFELSQLLSISASKSIDCNKSNVTNAESVFLKQPSSTKSSIYRYAFWSNAKSRATGATGGSQLHSYLALCVTNGMVLFYRLGKWKNDRPVLRQLPWYNHPSKQIAALCFDPSGSWLLIATKDASLYILLARKFVDPEAKLEQSLCDEDVTEIKMPGRRAMPTQICWWQTQDGQQIAIVGNELGEISFVNLTNRKEVGGTYINVGISELELVVDETSAFTYVLLTGNNNVQWQLILEQKETNYCWPLEKHDATETTDKNSNKAEDRFNSMASDKDTRPKRLTQYAGHTHLQCQYWNDRTLISGKYSPTAVLTVHNPDLNIVPKSIHKLPVDSCHIYLADRLLFVTTTDCSEPSIRIISTELSSTSIDGSKEYDQQSELQSFPLGMEENVLGLVGHTEADGCILFTDQAIYMLRSRMFPEDLFLELVLKEGDFSKADQFGKIFGLDATALYEKAADRKLEDGQVASAVRLYQLAKCSHIRTIANFATFGYVSELLSYLNVLFNTRNSDFSARDLKHFSNIALYCFIQQGLELHLSNSSTGSHFRDFLHTNQHYDERLAVRLLAAYGFYNLLLDLGDWRGLVPLVIAELLPQEGSIALKYQLKPRWADAKLATALAENGYEDLLMLSNDESFIRCLLSDGLPFYLGMHPELLQLHISLMRNLISYFDEQDGIRITLLKIYDPTHPAYVPILSKFRCRSQEKNEFLSTSSEFDFATDVPTLDTCCVSHSLIDMFLSLLAYLNTHHRSDRGYDPLLAQVNVEVEDKKDLGATQDFQLARHHTSIACGFANAAAVIDGSLYTWGRSASGCLGHGPVRHDWLPPEPVLRPPSVCVSSVACGAAHMLAVTDAGIFSWGLNSHGQLGFGNESGTSKRRCYPMCIEALAEMNIVSVACGQYHSIALMADGTPLTFGWGVHGQLGHGNAQNMFLPSPIKAMRGVPVSKVSAGYGHSLLLTSMGDVYVFGCGTFGQMATGQSAKENKPVRVELGEVISLVAAGYFHNVVVSTSGKVFTWGCNPQTLRMRAQAARRERALRNASSSNHNFEEKSSDDSLENSTSDPLNSAGIFVPRDVNMEGVSGQIVGVACGANHSLLLTADGTCYSWGRNYGGQLGLDTRKEQFAPTLISTLSNKMIVEVKCGADFSLVLDDGGKLLGFGMDDFGQVCGASESGHLADPNILPSPGKVFTVRTNKRIVQIKSSSRNSVFQPVSLNALPQITNRNSFEVTDAEFFPEIVIFRRFFKNDPSYSDAVLHAALERFQGLYDGATLEKDFKESSNFQAAAKVALLSGRYEQSLSFNLKSLEEDKSTASENRMDMALKLMEFYLGYVSEDAERLKSLLEQIILFWTNSCLPTEALEEFFVSHLHRFLGPLSMLIFSPVMQKDDGGRLGHFMSHISNRFCMMLVEQIIENVNSGLPKLEFLQFLSDMVHVDATSVKCAIDLPTTEVQELLRASAGTNKTRILAFTCGHHYPLSTAQESVLPRFHELLAAVAPQMSKTLVSTYETQGFQPMACPKCFIEGVRQEDMAPS